MYPKYACDFEDCFNVYDVVSVYGYDFVIVQYYLFDKPMLRGVASQKKFYPNIEMLEQLYERGLVKFY